MGLPRQCYLLPGNSVDMHGHNGGNAQVAVGICVQTMMASWRHDCRHA